MEAQIELPYPPSVNHYKKVGRPSVSKNGYWYTPMVNTTETKVYYWQVFMKIKSKGLESFGDAKIYVEVDVYPPDKRKRDLDGILKVLLDSMQKGGLYDDDHQICRLLVTRMSIIEHGKVVVRIKELPMQSPEQSRKKAEALAQAEKTNHQDMLGGNVRGWRNTVAELGNPDGTDHLNPPNGKYGV